MSKIDLGDLEKTAAEIADNLLNKRVAPPLQSDIEFEDSFLNGNAAINLNIDMPKELCPIPKRMETQRTAIPSTITVDHLSKPRQRAVSFQKPADTPSVGAGDTHHAIPETTNSNFFTIAGFNLPKTTLYLIIALIIIGVI